VTSRRNEYSKAIAVQIRLNEKVPDVCLSKNGGRSGVAFQRSQGRAGTSLYSDFSQTRK
jgi:hypothetical protein